MPLQVSRNRGPQHQALYSVKAGEPSGGEPQKATAVNMKVNRNEWPPSKGTVLKKKMAALSYGRKKITSCENLKSQANPYIGDYKLKYYLVVQLIIKAEIHFNRLRTRRGPRQLIEENTTFSKETHLSLRPQ